MGQGYPKLDESALDQLEALVPHLRRFARAYSGDGAVGDEAVRAALLALTDSPPLLIATLRRAAFRQVRYRLADPAPRAFLPLGEDDVDGGGLAALPPQTREILFLLHVEQFELADAAAIAGENAVAAEARLAAIAEL